MTLNDFLESGDMTAARLAKSVKVTGASLSRIRRGGQNISLDLALQIVAATGGKVSLEELSLTRQQKIAA